MIDRWIAALHSEDLTAEEIADATWLALIRQRAAQEEQSEAEEVSELVTPDDVMQLELEGRGDRPPPPPPDPSSAPPPQVSPPPTGVFPRQQKTPQEPPAAKETSQEKPTPRQPAGVPIKVLSAPAIRDPLAIMRSLRPLLREVPTGKDAGLNELATAQRIADERIWMPIMEPDLEPWLDLALVIDESPSMLIWRRTVLELQRLLKHYGAFRDVRTWGMVTVEAGTGETAESGAAQAPAPVKRQVYIRPEFGSAAIHQALRRPEELIDPKRRRLVLVITDCVSALWRDGTVLPPLRVWAHQGPMAIVQMLPEWMWDRTALRQAAEVQLSGLEPGLVNQQLSVSRGALLEEADAPDRHSEVRSPVITLEPKAIGTWSQVVAGKGNVQVPGAIFKPSLQSAWEQVEQRRQARATPEPTAEQQVQRFRAASTPMARRLAGLVAATPVIQLPVIRLIQEILVRESRQVHVAEVLLGGLLKPVTPPAPNTHPDEVVYEFIAPQMRPLLLDEAPVTDTTEVLSKYVTRHLGKASLDVFIAEVRSWLQGEGDAEGADLRPFAIVAAEVLKRRGGRYAEFVREVEQRWPPTEDESKHQRKPALPELKTLEFETAQVSENPQLITFEVATLARQLEPRQTEERRQGFFGRLFRRNEPQNEEPKSQWVIRRQTRQGRMWVEPLGDRLQLELMEIPAGRFVMGSPEDEPERSPREGPQQEVRVNAFWMGRYPVTQAQWRFVAGLEQVDRKLSPEPSNFKGDKRPVEQVKWRDAVEFCARLSRYTKREYRLPSEAEWEYACRAGTKTPFHFGETITTELANYNGSYIYGEGLNGEYRRETTEVDHFGVANAFGLCDMHGNVWEWCQDTWHRNYEGAPTDGSAWVTGGDNSYRVLRGGSWAINPRGCRSACRFYYAPDVIFIFIGFRVVCAPPGP